MFINFQQAQPLQPMVQQAAMGGSNQATTLALNEEGGDIRFTTLALGEEGGDNGTVTTQAVGEEGGGEFSVEQLHRTLFKADLDGDMEVNRGELESHAARAQNELSQLQRIRTFRYDPNLENRIQAVQRELDGSRFLLSNFDTLARLNQDPNRVNQSEIQFAAQQDGNPASVSNQDIQRLKQQQPGPANPGGNQNQLLQLFQMLLQMMQQMFSLFR